MRIGYARTSTLQEEQTKSLDGQVENLKNLGCVLVIAERRSAFRRKLRPGWDELRRLVDTGQVSELVVVDQSRLSRSGDDMQFLELCAARGTKVIALIGGVIETETIGGFLQAGVISVFSEMQSRLTAAKVRDGLRRRREEGYYACGSVPFGYAYDGKYLVRSPENWDHARRMWDQLIEMECNISGWLRKTNARWTPRGVKRWMNNPILRGVVRGDFEGTDALVTWQEWIDATHMLKLRSKMRGRAAYSSYLFTGIVICKSCSKSLHNVRDRTVPRLKCRNKDCSRYGQGIRVDIVRNKVVEALNTVSQGLELSSVLQFEDSFLYQQLCDRLFPFDVAQSLGIHGLEQKLKHFNVLRQQSQGLQGGANLCKSSDLLSCAKNAAFGIDDTQLRLLILSFIHEIVWPGGLSEVIITLRHQKPLGPTLDV